MAAHLFLVLMTWWLVGIGLELATFYAEKVIQNYLVLDILGWTFFIIIGPPALFLSWDLIRELTRFEHPQNEINKGI